MKTISFLFLVCLANLVLSQEKMTTSIGVINFEASVPLFEEVKAKNEKATCLLNLKTGEISSTVYIKDFHFKIPLMEKHFNENYMESHHYPKATFKGTIDGFNINIIGNSPKEFKLKGTLKLHGKSKNISTIAILKKSNNELEITTDFNINSKEFNIKIPEILSMKVAETVHIKTAFLVE
jgi:hypothetical protein